ncbi:MAG: hypothetical protein Q8R76_06755 [Candidatus Omnitrophota bacterium]|nr:hypothetical protein [Candidatus Omnitrophota bacterium]
MRSIKYAVKGSSLWLFVMVFCVIFTGAPRARGAELTGDNLAVFITGLSGGHQFQAYMDEAVGQLQEVLLANAYARERMIRFSESQDGELQWGKNVPARVDRLEPFMTRVAERTKSYENVFVFIAGHANGRDEEAKFHLGGEDVSYETLIRWIDGIPAERLILILAAPQGEVWIRSLSGPGRVLIVGNGFREFDFLPTLFLRLFPEIFRELSEAAEAEGIGSISLRDVFIETQTRVQEWYRVNGLHPTEVALIDADGDQRGETLMELQDGEDVPAVKSILFKIPGGSNHERSDKNR